MSTYSSYNDATLVSLLAKDDARAFDEIYTRYWKRMLGLAYAQLKQYQEAEDIVHDILTTLWQRRMTLSISSLEHWLAVAVKYKVINLINRRLSREFASEDLPELAATDSLLDDRLLEQQVASAINQLPEKSRIVFRFSRVDGYSNKQIASELGVSEKTVEKHISAARRQLSLTLRNLLHSLFSLL